MRTNIVLVVFLKRIRQRSAVDGTRSGRAMNYAFPFLYHLIVMEKSRIFPLEREYTSINGRTASRKIDQKLRMTIVTVT